MKMEFGKVDNVIDLVNYYVEGGQLPLLEAEKSLLMQVSSN
jgi:hypothetical protein